MMTHPLCDIIIYSLDTNWCIGHQQTLLSLSVLGKPCSLHCNLWFQTEKFCLWSPPPVGLGVVFLPYILWCQSESNVWYGSGFSLWSRWPIQYHLCLTCPPALSVWSAPEPNSCLCLGAQAQGSQFYSNSFPLAFTTRSFKGFEGPW